jgi:hypothetical protein
MKRTVLSLVIATVVVGGVIASFPNTAEAGHRRSRVGVFVGSGGISVGVGYGIPYRYHAYHTPIRPIGVYAPIVAPTCCHLERVYVQGYWDAFGCWHPGYYQTYRVCDHHGRVLAY